MPDDLTALAVIWAQCTEWALDPNTTDHLAWEMLETGVELGLCERVPFDPQIHGERLAEYYDPGQEITVLSERGRRLERLGVAEWVARHSQRQKARP